MTDVPGAVGATGSPESPSVDASIAATPRLRTIGYCADCGTWDEHGPTCLSCGYDFSGSETLKEQ